MRFFPSPWVFVLTGIVFNIFSAVITHYFIGLNNERISEINISINNRQVLIESLWQAKVESERKKEFFILFFAKRPEQDSPNLNPVSQYYEEYLLETARLYELKDFELKMIQQKFNNIEFLLEFSTAVQASIIESINDTYFEKLELEESKAPVEWGNSRLFSIAIFLQVIGLILILARDLKRS